MARETRVIEREHMFDLHVPFFNPLWRRVVVVAICLGWALVELAFGSVGFAVIFGAAGLYTAHQFFIRWTQTAENEDRNA
ncbi:hypothetical protein [Aliiroseovarius sediminilitoris]|nr:hypothetical protein [Aliiroseovarius sediminilitoris]